MSHFHENEIESSSIYNWCVNWPSIWKAQIQSNCSCISGIWQYQSSKRLEWVVITSAWSGLKFLGLGRAQTQKFRARALSGFSHLQISGSNGLGLLSNVKCGLFGLSGLEKSQFFFKKLKKKISSEITTTNFSHDFGQVCQFCETKSLSYNFEMF